MFPNLTTSSGVPTPLMKPQMKDLVFIKTVKWYNLGLQLGIEDTELDMIEQNNLKEIDACKRRMFQAWLRITPSPSYQQLVEALQTVGETSEADCLCKKYGNIMAVLEVEVVRTSVPTVFLFRDSAATFRRPSDKKEKNKPVWRVRIYLLLHPTSS